MDSFIYSINSTVPIFLVMIVGWVIKRLGVIDDHFANVANKYVFKVALPVLLFRDLSEADFYSQFDIRFVGYCAIVTIVMFGTVWILTDIFMKDKSMHGSFIQCSCRSSAAILGMAFIQNMYSDTGMAPLMIVAAVPLFNIISVIVLTFKANPAGDCSVAEMNTNPKNDCSAANVHLDTNHIDIADADKIDSAGMNNIKKACFNIVTNPIIIGILLGLLASLVRLQLPTILSKTVSSIAQTATPIALVCIGAGFEGRKAIKKIKPTVIGTFIKLVGLAAVFLPLAVWMDFRNQELVSILIMLASPTTVTCYIMAKNMDNDEVLASSMVVLATMLSSVTLTAWIFILRSMSLI